MTRDIILVGVGYVVGVLLMCWFGHERAQAVCGDCEQSRDDLVVMREQRDAAERQAKALRSSNHRLNATVAQMQREREAEQRADANLSEAIESWKESIAPLTPEQHTDMWEGIKAKMEPPPLWLPLGTREAPVRAPRGDTARFSTLDELTEGERE